MLLLGLIGLAAAAPLAPPVVSSYLRLQDCPNASCACASFSLNGSSLASCSAGGWLEQGCMLVHHGGSGGAPLCLTYGGFHEANTGLAACTGWSQPGIGGQTWAITKRSPGNRSGLQVAGEKKLLGVVDCGDVSAGRALEVCNPAGDDCGPKGAGCPTAFDWLLENSAPGSFTLHSGLADKVGWCVTVTQDHPPQPKPDGPPVGPFPGGGGPFSQVCNASAACPVQQTCCKMASSNWGCCPGPDAVCCPGGATCCPKGFECGSVRCKAPTDASGSVATNRVDADASLPVRARELPNWPPVGSSRSGTAGRREGPPNFEFSSSGASATMDVRSTDKSAAVSIDAISGNLISVSVGAGATPKHVFGLKAQAALLPLANQSWTVVVSQLQNGAGVRVVRRCEGHAEITEQYSADPSAPSAIRVELSLAGLNASGAALHMPFSSAFAFDPEVASAELSWWAPWDRASYHSGPDQWVDPLRPSDGHFGFWPGAYNYGIVYGGGVTASDMVVAPVIAVLHNDSDSGFSLQMNPADAGLAWGDSWLEGINSTTTQGFAWHRNNLRIDSSTVQTFNMHIATHEACWRPAMQFHVAQFPKHWSTVASPDKVAEIDGLGSYGSFPIPQLGETGNLSAPSIKNMHYKVNWDLSGRFYHFMGMYAPPTDGSWLNRWNPFGGGGGRLTYNVSYTEGAWSQDALYKQAQELGFATLSYCNVFEYGMNILGHAAGAAVLAQPDDYRNATLYAQNHLQDSILQSNWNDQSRTTSPNHGAWDNGVLMDPGRDSYKNEMIEQTRRRIARIPHFQGLVVDRSDYARYYNLLHDDGVTMTPSTGANKSWSMKRSYLEVIRGIRATMGREGVMLMNTLGYSSLSMMADYDGTFSEGRAINAVGLLGAGGMVNIMWTSSNLECCRHEAAADIYFQQRLYMGVYPMAPLPAADHCIDYNSTIIPWFVNYGPLFESIQGKRYNLEPHAVAVVDGSDAKANAFVGANGSTFLYPLVLATGGAVTVELNGLRDASTFDALFPGGEAGGWSGAMVAAQRVAGAVGRWRVVVRFGGSKAHHAAILRAR